MKSRIISIIFCLNLYFAGNAQTIIDSTIKYETFPIELKTSSQKTNHDCYYETITKKLETGDRVFLSYTSTKFLTEIYIKFPSGKLDTVFDCSTSLQKTGSYSEFSFESDESGNFIFYLSSINPRSVGEANFMLAIIDAGMIRINPTWNVCEKLNYILNLSHTDFQLITTIPLDNDIGTAVNCNILNEAPARIFGLSNCNKPQMYQTIYIRDVNLATAKLMIQGVNDQISKCLTNDWTINKTNNSTTSLPEIIYIQKGNYEYEFNKVHRQNNFKNKVCLKIERHGSFYNVILEIF